MPSGHSERGERLARIALLIAMAISAATILYANRQLTFWSDELDWLTFRDDFAPAHMLTPHGSHLLATTRVIYEGLPRLFGSSYLPFRILAVLCLQANAVLLFVLVRRRLGPGLAVLPAIVLLFYGSAQDMFISPLGIPFTLSIALGLGALAAVEMRSLRGDVLAMVLLSLSILSHTFGTIVAIGVAVYYALDRGRRRELWVALVPLALWFAWWLWARQFDQSIASAANLPGVPVYLLKSLGAAIEGIFGIPPNLGGKSDGLALALRIGFDLVGLAAALLLAVHIAARRASAWTWAYLVTIVAFWAGVGLADGVGREPTTPRYLFFGAIMLTLIAAEVFRDRRPSQRGIRAIGAVFAICLAGNFALLIYEIPGFEEDATAVRAQIAVLGIEGDNVDPRLQVRKLGPPASEHVPSPVAAIGSFERDVGPLGLSIDELRGEPDEVRSGADFVLIRGLGTAVVPLPADGGLRPQGCSLRRPAADGYTSFELSPGGNVVELTRDSGEPGAELELGRFADVADVPIGGLRKGRKAIVLLPDDELADPWIARTTGTVRVCALAPPR